MAPKHPKEELISALVDGRLDARDTHRVAMHLRECAVCRATLTEFEANKALYRKLKAPEPLSDQFWNDTFRTLRTRAGSAPALDPGTRPLALIYRRLAAMAVTAACVGIAVLVPLTHRDTVIVPPAVPVAIPIAQDALDDIDVASFVRAHTESVASQPLSDPDRQQMISADVDAAPLDDQASAATENADVSP